MMMKEFCLHILCDVFPCVSVFKWTHIFVLFAFASLYNLLDMIFFLFVHTSSFASSVLSDLEKT